MVLAEAPMTKAVATSLNVGHQTFAIKLYQDMGPIFRAVRALLCPFNVKVF